MDTSNMNPDFLKFDTGIIIGKDTAPLKLIELINVRCPYCKQWHDDNNDLLMSYVEAGQLQRSIKLFDKEKPGLNKGNIMHRYISKSNGKLALSQLSEIYNTQNTWGELEFNSDIIDYARHSLKFDEDYSESYTQTICKEADLANTPFIPTMYLEGSLFDQNISRDELLSLLNKKA